MPTPKRELCGVPVPDTALVTRALEEARSMSEPYLFNHAVRSWLFGVRIAELNGARYDAEVVAVSSLLHDFGLTTSCKGERRFEVEGADHARTLAQQGGLVFVRGELWQAATDDGAPLEAGAHVRVEEVDGLRLKVHRV